MDQKEIIGKAYKGLGDNRTFYDGMITCSTFIGKLVCRIVWGMGRDDCLNYLSDALSGIPEGFSSRMLEIPVGTGILTMPIYRNMPYADITCMDYSEEMLNLARNRGKDLSNVYFQQGDVGNLPYDDDSFDLVLSLNGFHAFPDKAAAWNEIYRVLKPGGIFCGCFYVCGEKRRTDWFVRNIYVPRGFFTPPFETAESLESGLNEMYEQVKVSTIKGIATFRCRKSE